MTVRHAQFDGGLVRQGGEGCLIAANAFGHHDAGIIARLNDDTAYQIGNTNLSVHPHEHFRAAHAPGFFTDGKGIVQAQTPGSQTFKQHV